MESLDGLDSSAKMRRQLNEDRGNDHRTDRDGQKYLILGSGQELILLADLCQDKAEFSHLCESDAGHDCGSGRHGGGKHGTSAREEFHQEDDQQKAGHDEGVLQQDMPIHQDADGNEEEAVETVTKGQHFGDGLVAVLRLGDHEAGDEGAERQ